MCAIGFLGAVELSKDCLWIIFTACGQYRFRLFARLCKIGFAVLSMCEFVCPTICTAEAPHTLTEKVLSFSHELTITNPINRHSYKNACHILPLNHDNPNAPTYFSNTASIPAKDTNALDALIAAAGVNTGVGPVKSEIQKKTLQP